MDQAERRELIRVLSPDRFSTYVSAAGDEDHAFQLYEWNVFCSEPSSDRCNGWRSRCAMPCMLN